MKHLLLCFIALAASNMSFGQLTGPKYIPGTGGINDYPTIAMAIADLNLKGVGSGGVTFNVAAGYAEFITAPLQVTATGTMLNPIIFHKNPITVGPNPMVSAGYPGTATPASPFQDGIWALIGSDYVTIDGIDLNDPNTANPMSMEYGYGLFKKSDADGCQFNIIRNCMVTLWRGNNVAGSGPAVDGSRAINVVNSMITGQTTALTINNPAGSNSNNGFYSNTLQNCNIGIALIGYVAPAPFLFADQNNDIGGMSPNTGNNIINYGGAVAAGRPAAGVRTQNQYGLNVSYNTINNNNGSGVNHPSTLRGIYLQEAISASATISHNTLTITGGSTTSQISVIENVSGSTAAGNTININNNTIVNCTWPTATTGIFYGIWNGSSAFTVNIFGNVLSNISSPSSGLCYLIHGGSPVNLNMYNNEIGNVIKTLSGTLYGLFAGTTNLSVHDNNVHHLTTMGGGNAIYGFYDVSSPVNETYYNNHFYNFTNNGTGGVFGIYTNTAAGARNIYGNTINTFAANGGGPIYGIYGAKSSQTIYKNRIYDLMSGSANGIVYGIYLVSGDAVNIYNNYISDLRTPAAQNNNVLSGIFLSITTAINLNVYYNTIYLEGTSTGNLFSSAALYVNTIPILDLQDNILINNCQPTGLGTASAFRRNNTNLATYALSSDYNNYFVPGLVPNQFIFYDGTTGYATLPAYKFLVGPVRDVSSFTENSPFVNAALNDFHINTTLPTLCESGGIRVISPISVTTDYDNDLRWGEPGYVGTGTAPDVGADEFDGFNPLACNPPPNVTILMLSPFSAMISWIPPTPPPSVGYEYEVRTYGMPGSGPDGLFTSGGTSEMNIVVPGLAGGTTYSFYIRSNCGNGIFSPWSAAYPFTTPMETIITGSLTDSLGVSPPPATVYIVAHTACNPDDTLSTLNGGIAYTLGPGNVGTYTVHCNNFLDPPDPGEQVYISFFNTSNLDFNPAIVEMSMMPITYCHIIVTPVRHVNLPYRTSFTWVWMPPHSSLKIHYTHVVGCGNTDVFEWVPGSGYVKIRQWNWNHYCTWRYLTNNTNVGKCIKIHNDNGNINFDMQLTYLIVPLSPSNYNLFALFNMGWRNRPYPSCEFGNIVAPSHTYVDFEGASLTNFPSRLGQDGVQNLTIQFQSYDNIFWNDMNMMIDLVNITQPGTLELYIPDATIPLTSAVINPGDTACFFNPGGILAPGTHTMTLSASGGLSIGIDALNYTTSMPVPAIPTVATTPVTNITYHSAVSGGTVTNDGGAAVTARGVCWSTTPNPTLLDSYTTDGSGLGTFTSLATPLLPSTQYYLRAYATNLAGTGYGNELLFMTTQMPGIISGAVTDSTGMSPLPEHLYIVAHTRCNPNDTLSTLNGGIAYSGGGGGGAIGYYTIHCSNFQNPPQPGEQVFVSFYNTSTLEFDQTMVEMLPGPVTIYNTTIRLASHVYLPYRTSSVCVLVPPHRSLQIHYTYVVGCGNTDVFEWSGSSWIKFRQWNFNHYCTWRYITNTSNKWKLYRIHNDNGIIRFDLMFYCPYLGPTTASNNNLFALINMGWRDRPYATCEFGNIQTPAYTFIDYEGASLGQFPARLGSDGVQNLTIQFESYNNQFWNDMNLMIDLVNVTQPGQLRLFIPDAGIPEITLPVMDPDTVLMFNPGGILSPGTHTMTLTAMGGLSMGIDAFNFTSVIPVPNLPTVTTAPVTSVTSNSAVSGGNAVADGGAAVTAKGVCWSTSPNPTLLNSFTVDGSGLGTFTSLLSGLSPLTTYHVRAYATNLAGTAYGQELIFVTLPMQILITGTVTDSTGLIVPSEHLYIIAYNPCNPNDTLTTLNGGITLASGGQYTVHCNNFLDPPEPGKPVIMSFFDVFMEAFTPETVELSAAPITIFNPVVYFYRPVHLPFRTAFVRVVVPPHKTLQIHYTFVNGCGNTDVFEWNGSRYVKFRQWNWNHYCTWKYIQNNSNVPKMYIIHNDNGNIRFDLTFHCPIILPTSPSNYSAFALFNMGWRDRPYPACEFGNIQAVNHTYIDYEGAFLDNFPARLGPDGVQNLTIQFESYNNQFWNDMNLMIDLVNVTQPGYLQLTIPDAGIPEIIMPVMPGDTAVYFYPGGILSPGIHTMTLTTMGGLSVGMDAFNFTSMVPVPDVPTVTTAPVYSITYTSAVSGGNVTADGGAAVTARGVCWSTSPNPTLLNSYTVDGSGLGIYPSLLTSLLPSTTYYVRAYATNLAGTGYGNELSFTTWALVPEFRTVQNVTVAAGQTVCYDATNTITVAGGSTYFIVQPGGSATFVAGMKIRFLEGTRAFAGAYMHGYIDQTGTYCNYDAPVGSLITNNEVVFSYERSNFRLYPNPTTGDFTLEQKGATLYANVRVEVYSMTGEKVLRDAMAGERRHEFRFSDIQPGIYFVKVVTSDYVETIKLLKAR